MANKVVYLVTGLFVLFLIIASVVSIYKGGMTMIPGLAPKVYKSGDEVDLLVNKVTSIHAPIPYRYHDLPVCQPTGDDIDAKVESLGEVLTGNRIEKSSFKIKFLDPSTQCHTLCEKELNVEQVQQMRELVKEEYMAQWQIDGLPAARRVGDGYETGFPLGFTASKEGETYGINNHVDIIIHYNTNNPTLFGQEEPAPTTAVDQPTEQYNIVFFEVNAHSNAGDCTTQSGDGTKVILGTAEQKVKYSYTVTFKKSKVNWPDRWQQYMATQGEGQIHWFSIINSLMIVFFLSGMVAMIMARTIRRDFMRYTEEENDEVEETGWKLVHADVFRPPQKKELFAVLVGSGVQVFYMCVVTMVFAVLGVVSPASQGSVISAVLCFYVWMGIAAGYSSSRVYQMFGGERRSRNTLLTALFFPGIIFTIAFILNLFLWYKHSSGAFPFTTMLVIMALWLGFSVPLCFVGSHIAYKRDPPKHPGTVNHIDRYIPPQKWYMYPISTILMGGVLPFGAVFIELFFILSSIWLQRYYFLFGFLFLVFLILVITCAEISIVMCYFQLCSEDWQWWWRSFLTPGASALYMFFYAIFYYVRRLDVDGFVPTVIYFGYTLILCLFFFVLTGTIGFYSCYWFVKKIYSLIHQD